MTRNQWALVAYSQNSKRICRGHQIRTAQEGVEGFDWILFMALVLPFNFSNRLMRFASGVLKMYLV